MKNKKQISYTIVNHLVRKELKLTMNEYALLDLVYNLSNNSFSPFPDWCYASKVTLGEMLTLSRQSVYDLIKRLISRKFLKKDKETKFLQVAIPDWRSKTTIRKEEDVKNPYTSSKTSLQTGSKSLHPASKESVPYKDNNDKDKKRDVHIGGFTPVTPETNLNPPYLRVLETSKEQLATLPDYLLIYRYFLISFHKTPDQVKLTENRKELIIARLENYSIEDIFKAILNASLSDHYSGKNESGWKLTLEWLMEQDERIERLRDLEVSREM